MVQLAGLSEKEVVEMAKTLLGRLANNPMIPLEQFLLSDSDPIIIKHLNSLTIAPPDKKRLKGKWTTHHATGWSSSRPWWEPSDFRDDKIVEQFPGLVELGPRQLDVLENLNIKLPESDPSTIDVNPSLGRCRSIYKNSCQCLTSTSIVYLPHRARRAHGVEHLRLMGFLIDELDDCTKSATTREALQAFDSQTLKNLAGNAFDSSSYSAAFLILLMILGEVSLRTQQRRTATASLRAMSNLWGNIDSDDEV